LHEWPNIFPLKVTQISHAFGLLQLPAQSKPLLPRYIGETGSSPATLAARIHFYAGLSPQPPGITVVNGVSGRSRGL
ncbi:MAG: hypothetical protein WBX09_03030, partial [Terracidiphilus sp.]